MYFSISSHFVCSDSHPDQMFWWQWWWLFPSRALIHPVASSWPWCTHSQLSPATNSLCSAAHSLLLSDQPSYLLPLLFLWSTVHAAFKSEHWPVLDRERKPVGSEKAWQVQEAWLHPDSPQSQDSSESLLILLFSPFPAFSWAQVLSSSSRKLLLGSL